MNDQKHKAIPKPFANDTCKMGQGAACCKYLGADPNGFCCLKDLPELKEVIDKRTDMHAKSDNCDGWSKKAHQ